MKNITDAIFIFVAGIFVLASLAVIMAFPTMWLWNGCLMPAIDAVNEISLLQALGINVLASILFSNTPSTSKNND